VLQNLDYTYDPVGNISEILDDAHEPVFFNNQRVEPRSRYSYDALYRLIETSGRENHQATDAPDRTEAEPYAVRFPISDQALRNYSQSYAYDAVGNILEIRHRADGGSWTRQSTYATNSNRLLRSWTGDGRRNAVDVRYDSHGSMLNLANTPEAYGLRWDYRDMIHRVNLGGGGQAFYSYDAGKQRSRKRIEHNGNRVEERLYLGGMEVYRRWLNGSLVEEIETHHLFAGEQRLLIVEDVQLTDNPNLNAGLLHRYQYGNHLGSVSLELTGDEDPQVISYEEYHPYGTTAYRARNAALNATAKRYRYTGMERDEETGLSYHTARYYLPWLGRWVAADRNSNEICPNLYAYVCAKPILLHDSSGNYGEVGHFYTVYFLSLAAGFDPRTAFQNAVFSQLPDEVRALDAVDMALSYLANPSYLLQAEVNLVHRALHALTGTSPTEERSATREALRDSEPGSIQFGFLLHRFGDTYAHSVMGNESRLYDTFFGHLQHWHAPDQIHTRPELYRTYVEDLFTTLSQAALENGHEPRLTPDQIERFATEISNIRVYRIVYYGPYQVSQVLDIGLTEQAQISRIRELSEQLMPRSEPEESIVGPLTVEQASQPPIGRMQAYAPESQDGLTWSEYNTRNPDLLLGVTWVQAAHIVEAIGYRFGDFLGRETLHER